MANGTIFGENLTMPEQDRLIPQERGWITRRFDLPPHNILDTYLVPPSYKPQINFGEQCRNAKKHVKCHNKNVKWLMKNISWVLGVLGWAAQVANLGTGEAFFPHSLAEFLMLSRASALLGPSLSLSRDLVVIGT
ncbi:hypothetical protein C8F04DRAFT_1198984 [Mycena alexandri]|uniref:Uncharacterized protein n=1 Tax=Mycena alexandri TaxID=1745969 RepID=A0AAD6S0M4_9AGAR|nr:hypothetical protein C8F04DRAFT_1198984 [Mycena alexandri]